LGGEGLVAAVEAVGRIRLLLFLSFFLQGRG
jgi:hypothetical protein